MHLLAAQSLLNLCCSMPLDANSFLAFAKEAPRSETKEEEHSPSKVATVACQQSVACLVSRACF